MQPSNETTAALWQLPAVAAAQRALVETQLADETSVPPFLAFLRAMRVILDAAPALETSTLLDVGCGVGHYGVLLQRHYPRMNYVGTDASAAMLAVSFQKEQGIIGVLNRSEFEDVPFQSFPLLLVGQVMELLPDPATALSLVLERVRPRAYLILHRMRMTLSPAHAVIEKTYLGMDAQNYIWNAQSVIRACMAAGDVLNVDKWDDCTTIVLRKE